MMGAVFCGTARRLTVLRTRRGEKGAMYRLMIVDGDEEVCEGIRYLLDWRQYGISGILTASTYGEAVNCMIDVQPHIALVNVSLGEHWGYELAEYIRDIGGRTVFCMMHSQADFQALRKSMRAGAKDYLLTPLDARELREFLERTIVCSLGGTLPRQTMTQPEVDPVLQKEYSQLSRITAKIILIVKSNYRRSQSLTSIAETLNMSSKYIGRIFLKDTGMKFSEYLTAYRMIQARRLVENTQEKIAVVASMVGYSQLNNFYVHFKKYYHVSPNALRRVDEGQASPALPASPDLSLIHI